MTDEQIKDHKVTDEGRTWLASTETQSQPVEPLWDELEEKLDITNALLGELSKIHTLKPCEQKSWSCYSCKGRARTMLNPTDQDWAVAQGHTCVKVEEAI